MFSIHRRDDHNFRHNDHPLATLDDGFVTYFISSLTPSILFSHLSSISLRRRSIDIWKFIAVKRKATTDRHIVNYLSPLFICASHTDFICRRGTTPQVGTGRFVFAVKADGRRHIDRENIIGCEFVRIL